MRDSSPLQVDWCHSTSLLGMVEEEQEEEEGKCVCGHPFSTHPATYPPIHILPIHPPTYPPIHPPTYPLSNPFTLLPIQPLSNPSTPALRPDLIDQQGRR
ncbi:hypothetical protein Pmani_034144 [Petrolisthes manimaculis]|uniref:Uncharacterized protein n=1 Tax=Petrolisthes manimaculis TaxID=1843537 RepID=A0AAE1NPU5_9EUCA|nr:hypothetical protein Pmani_034144 [Petrolisthes manimaculis]